MRNESYYQSCPVFLCALCLAHRKSNLVRIFLKMNDATTVGLRKLQVAKWLMVYVGEPDLSDFITYFDTCDRSISISLSNQAPVIPNGLGAGHMAAWAAYTGDLSPEWRISSQMLQVVLVEGMVTYLSVH